MAKTERSRGKNLNIIAETHRWFERTLKFANDLYSPVKISTFLALCLLSSSSSSAAAAAAASPPLLLLLSGASSQIYFGPLGRKHFWGLFYHINDS